LQAVRHYPGGPDDRATATLRRYQQATGREPPTRLTVACQAGHVLARVVETAEGLVVTGRYTAMTLYRTEANGGPDYVRRRGRPRETAVAVLLDPLHDDQAVIVQCRCRTNDTAELRASWLRARLAERRGRAVYASGS
jgi:hypothetical protein